MEALMRGEAKMVVEDHKNSTGLYDGIIYIMRTRAADGTVVPRLSPPSAPRLALGLFHTLGERRLS